MNPLLSTHEVQTFLNSFPSASRRRGKHYYADGAVLRVACEEEGWLYTAVVRGGEDYEVAFEYDADEQTWFAECSCPVGQECKHAFAAMLALRDNALKLSVPAPPTRIKGRKKAKPAAVTLREEPQPPASTLSTALAQALGRKLDREETQYVQRIQWNFQKVREGYNVTSGLLTGIDSRVQSYSWERLDLWPASDIPRDDLRFWLYVAWELRRRQIDVPEFLLPVTDFSTIEPAVKAWEREKEVESWRRNLANGSVADTQDGDEPAEFRVAIYDDRPRVQWKAASEKEFHDLKQTQLRRFAQKHLEGNLNVVPEAWSLWLTIYNPYDFHTACNFSFENHQTVKVLGRILRLPEAVHRLVTPDGLPLERPSESLRYQIHPAASSDDDYRLELVRSDGSPAPPVLAALPGRPTLYLTQRALFQGPPAHNFGLREPVRIPAPALECLEGVNFLQRLKAELPQRLAEKTRPVPVKVTLTCELKPTYPGSDTDALHIRLTAAAEGQPAEHCSPSGWSAKATFGQPRQARGNGFIPLIDRSAQDHFPARLEALGAKWEDYYGSWRVRLSKNFPQVFLPWLEALPPGIEVRLDRELATLRDAPISGSVRLDVEEAGVDWFDLRVALNVTDTQLTPAELKLLLNARGGYVRLGKKGWRRLKFDLTTEDDERLARLGLNPRDFSAEPQRLHALQLADEAARKFLPEQQAEAIHRRAAELKTRVTPPVPAAISAELRPYQLSGYHFLSYLTTNRFGGVLADDMGLGKTVQALTWLAWLREQDPARNGNPAVPSLVVCPKSVMDNWQAEARRFFRALRVRLWQGEEPDALPAARAENDLLVVNYAQLRGLSPQIAEHRWQVALLDEAQYIKNPDSQTAQAARALKADHRLALTGTPIENRLLDLWSIFAFAMPGVLGNRTLFAKRYNSEDDPFARRRLAARVRPFLLRRTKGQVAQDLPDRVEEDLMCELEGEQKTLYRAEFKRAQQLLLSVNTQKELNEQRFNFLTSLLRLRQICCHPALVSAELRQAESAKVSALLDLLEPLMEEGHKVLVFSQFVTMLDILRESLQERGWKQFYLAGDTEHRGALVEKFQTCEEAAVFLISLKAGGFGLNLTAASYVVLFDPWWNPAVEMQAIDRTHRIGQTSKVIAYRLLMKDSIEQRIRQLQRTKAALAEDVLGEERFAQALTLDDLRFLFAE